MLTEDMLAAYLARIGMPGPLVLDAQALRDLHQAHLVAVPFENLSIHLGEPISLNEGDLLDKIVVRRRGGFCYELNGGAAHRGEPARRPGRARRLPRSLRNRPQQRARADFRAARIACRPEGLNAG